MESESEDKSLNDKKPWNKKQIGKVLLIIIIADLEQFIDKSKFITYNEIFIKLYYQKNRRQVHKIYGIIELKKWHFLTAKYLYNLGGYCIIEISSILHNIYIVPRD